MRVLITGDLHGNPERLQFIQRKENFTAADVIVVMGDVGAKRIRKKDEHYNQNVTPLKHFL